MSLELITGSPHPILFLFYRINAQCSRKKGVRHRRYGIVGREKAHKRGPGVLTQFLTGRGDPASSFARD